MTQAGLYTLGALRPSVAPDAFIAPGAQVIGDVCIGAGASVWFNCVLRGDGNFIRVGDRTNIQDGTVVHISTKTHPTIIGADCLIGHMALVHACELQDGAYVGLGAVVMDGAVIERGGMLAAGSLLAPGKVIGAGQLWLGRPARYVRDLTAAERSGNAASVEQYAALAQAYRRDLKPL